VGVPIRVVIGDDSFLVREGVRELLETVPGIDVVAGLLFEVADNGRGFDASASDGAGLTNLRDRLGAVGGTLRVESTPGQGTRIHGAVPVD
jgi:LytS/YehU family sensor histidine kinase